MLALLLGWLVAGCGESGPRDPGDVTIVVGSKDTAEEEILGEIYAQALEAAGFAVERRPRLGPGLPPFEREGLVISGYPEHLNLVLKDILRLKHDVPGDPAEAYALTREGLEERGLTAFPPTPFSRSKAVGVLKETARERNLKTLTDLKAQAGEMTIKADDFCHFLTDCLVGLERFYGISFMTYGAVEPAQRYEVLESGEADASILLSTEGRLAGKRSPFVILEDDKQRLPAGNVVWLTRTDVVEEAGPRYERTIVAAQRGLTLEAMQELHATVKIAGRPPAQVAADYLKSISGRS